MKLLEPNPTPAGIRQKARNSRWVYLASIICLLMVAGCDSDNVNNNCYKVRVITVYCSRQNTALVSFEKSNKYTTKTEDNSIHHAAITDFPKEFLNTDSTYYVQLNHDIERENEFWKDTPYCAAVFSKVKILTLKSISPGSCNP